VLGTSGYEEAAALGFVAGVNAVAAVRGSEPLVIGRDEGYIGVLVDDVIGREHDEPYRMLTSRAEHRLLLGVDSARERLMGRGAALGLVPERVFHVEHSRWATLRAAAERLEEAVVRPDRETCEALRQCCGLELRSATTWAGLLRRQDVDIGAITSLASTSAASTSAASTSAASSLAPVLEALDPDDRDVVAGRVRYRGYVERHLREQERLRRLAGAQIPEDLDPAKISGLSREVVEQLRRYRPRTLAEAERVPGITAAALAILAGCLSRRRGGEG
jgi:tRNA uridine 5-carboxymethylaminomethyl modification enzyme